MVVLGYVAMAMAATTTSGLASYRYLTMTCDGGSSVCGGGTVLLSLAAFVAGMVCMGLAERAHDR